MRRQITDKFLGEVVEVGRFVMGIGLGGFVTWVLAASAASPKAHLHAFAARSYSLLGVTTALGAALWVLGAVVKPDLPAGPPGPPGPTGPTGPPGPRRIGVGNIFEQGYPPPTVELRPGYPPVEEE